MTAAEGAGPERALASDAVGAPRTAAGTPYVPRAALEMLLVLAGMAIMVTYVETMVLPAFRQFYTFFDGPPETTIAWILSAYLLVGTVATPIFGKLGDKYGKRRMLLVVMSIYAVAVTVAGFTPNLGSALGIARPDQIYLLIGVRAVQGIGMAMFPLAFAMIPEAFPAARVGVAQGVVSAMFATGAALGLAVGGWIAETSGWQVTYHTVIPVAVLLLVLAARLLRESPHTHPNPIDRPGITSLASALALFLLGLTEGTRWGWTNLSAVTLVGPLVWGVPEFFVGAALALAFFLYWEPREPYPVVSFPALRERNLLLSNVGGVLVGMTMFLTFVTNTVLSEYLIPPGFNLSEFSFGLVALPAALSMLAFGPVLGLASSRLGPKPVMVVGFLLSSLGATGLLFDHGSVLALAVLAVPVLVGVVAVMIAMTNVIVLSVSPKELGIHTGMNLTFRNLGSAVGPVVATTVLASFLTTAPPPYPPGPAFADAGFAWVYALTALVAASGFFLALGLRNYRFAADGTRRGHPSPGPTFPTPSAPGHEEPVAGASSRRS